MNSNLFYLDYLLTVAAGEAVEAELNKAGPGSCKFVACDMSKEDDIKVKCFCSQLMDMIPFSNS